MFGPLLFSLYINITEDINLESRLFVDDCVCYCETKVIENRVKLQEDIDCLGSWASSWGKRFQLIKCKIIQITRVKWANSQFTLLLKS